MCRNPALDAVMDRPVGFHIVSYINPFDVVPFCFFPISLSIIPHIRLGAHIYLFPFALSGPEDCIYHVSTAAQHPDVRVYT